MCVQCADLVQKKKALHQYTVLQIDFFGHQNTRLFLEHAKILSNFLFPSKRCKRSQWVDESKPLRKAFKHIY